jgi:hypothetical protein
MRWKLLFVAPLLAAAVAAGAVILCLSLLYTSRAGGPLGLAFFLLPPLATASGAGVFVYRHTPRRRVFQAFASALLSLALFYAAVLAAAPRFFRY